MLGLSPPTILTRPPLVRATYTSDFTSDNDSWAPAGIEGTLTQTYNQDIPGGSGGGWMKNVYDTNQANSSGLAYTNLLPASQGVGDFVILKFKLYLDNDWDGSDNVTQLVNPLVIGGIETEIPQDEVVEVYLTSNSSVLGFYTPTVTIMFAEDGDLPQAGAIFWIKDISCISYKV